MDLLKSENSDFISCPALSHMKTKHYNEPDILPSTDDLVRLNEYTDKLRITEVVVTVGRNMACKAAIITTNKPTPNFFTANSVKALKGDC